MSSRKLILTLLTGLCLLSMTACSTIVNAHLQKESMMENYLAGKNGAVREKLEDKLDSLVVGSGDEIMWRLEAGSFFLHTGNYEESIKHFDVAEQLMEEYDKRAIVNVRQIGSETSVLLTNPNALPYRAFCRDRVMCVVYRALAYLGKKDENGFRTELFRLREVQDKVADLNRKYFEEESKSLEKAKKKNAGASKNINEKTLLSNDKNSEVSKAIDKAIEVAHEGYANYLNPLAIFLSGYGYARDGNWENAIVDFQRLWQALPNSPMIRQYYAAALRRAGRTVPAELQYEPVPGFFMDRDNVLVIFASGRSAAFRQIALYIPIVLPAYLSLVTVAWPVCEYYDNPVSPLTVSAGKRTWQTQKIAGMDGILSLEYKDRLPGMITRIVLSTAVKEAASYAATYAAARQDPWVGVAVAVGTGVYKAVFNTADTRTWETLPKEFQITQFAMPTDRTITFSTGKKFKLSPRAKSAIIFVNAPSASPAAVSYHVFELKNR